MQYAIIGGTNIETLPLPFREEAVSTPYGDVVVLRARLPEGNEVIFLSRHGVLYEHDPTKINYRANIYGLYKLGVTNIIGVTSVGACDYSYKVGCICLLSDFLDFTKGRPSSFERSHRQFLHTGMEDVFDPAMNDRLESLIRQHGLPYAGRAVYACAEGPRFETAAEIRMARTLGAQVTGMTIVPEAPLAKDIGIPYACVGIITNYSTGMTVRVTDADISANMKKCRADVFELCFDIIRAAERG